MQIVRINAKIIQDDSGVFTEIPVLLDENQDVIKPLMEYTLKLKRDGMSQSTILNCIKATQLLLEYMSTNTSGFQNPESLFENFTSRLYTGTIGDDGLDPSGLYWLPCSKQVSKLYINALTKLTDWLALNNNGNAINPLVEANTSTKRLKYAAWFRKNHNNFLGHLKDTHIHLTARYARNIQGKRPLGKQSQEAIEFPEHHFSEFYFNGLGGAIDRRVVLRDQLILLLMHGGGLRESETMHLWVEDVSIDPLNTNSMKVRIYHPQDGKAPNNWRGRTGKTTRAAYLKEQYALSPRNDLMGKKRVGWKSTVTDSKDEYLEVHWFPSIFGEVFARLWKDYIRFLTVIERNHPYAFINFHRDHIGKPYTLNAFHNSYRQGLKRIGLTPCKPQGLSPHSHRHSYGRRLRRAGIPEVVIKKCLHHASLESQIVYTSPTAKEVSNILNAASISLLTPTESVDQTTIPSWVVLMEHGFSDIDPIGLFTGKNPKLGKIL